MKNALIRQGFVLPVTVVGVVPLTICWVTEAQQNASWASALVAAPFLALGLALLLATTRLFEARGGSLAPWNPPTEMITRGAYRYMRNPMILGVLLILSGETIALQSPWIGLWTSAFAVAKHTYIVLKEEPTLRARFGEPYVRYCRDVPRWLPRVRRNDTVERATVGRHCS